MYYYNYRDALVAEKTSSDLLMVTYTRMKQLALCIQ